MPDKDDTCSTCSFSDGGADGFRCTLYHKKVSPMADPCDSFICDSYFSSPPEDGREDS